MMLTAVVAEEGTAVEAAAELEDNEDGATVLDGEELATTATTADELDDGTELEIAAAELLEETAAAVELVT